MSAVAEHTLQAVAVEVGVTLQDARTALETYAEGMSDPKNLAVCAERLHEVFGVLRVIEIFGAALLAEEMESVARFLSTAAPDIRNQPEGLDPLMRAMVQLPAYLERVLAGGRDVPLVLLPLLNDLRAVRGQALLSEGTLLLLNLTSDRKPEPVDGRPGEVGLSVAQWARRLRPKFQLALLGILRGERIPQHLEVLAQVSERLEKTAQRQSVFQLWWVVGAVVEALRHGSSDGAATLKRLLGQADREMRRLYEIGESKYAEAPPIDLLNNLLYFVARTPAAGERIAAVRASFRLQDLLPVSEEVEDQRASLSAPSVKLMETVGSAIREDLARVKDSLDVFVRSGGTRTSDLADQTELLRKIGDTLGVLGLAAGRTIVQEQMKVLGDLVSRGSAADSAVLVDIAAALIRVEDSIDSQLKGLILPKTVDPNGSEPIAMDPEYQNVQSAVLRECIVNLAHVKESVAAAIAGHDATGADHVAALLNGISAGLLMLSRQRAVEIFGRISRHVLAALHGSGDPAAQRLDRLADAIVSIEYYMETLQSGRSEPVYMLDNAEACLKVLEGAGQVPVPTAVLGSLPSKEAAQKPQEMPPIFAQMQGNASEATPKAQAEDSGVFRAAGVPPPASHALPSAESLPAVSEEVDPDLIQLFIEEAREELPKIQDNLQAWDRNPLDDESLTRLRRSFHTLKGSGRMVGARLMGDYAWTVENLLNRIISGTRNRTGPLLAALRDAAGGLPALIDQLETRQAPKFDVASLMARLQAFSDGRDVEIVEDAFEGTDVDDGPVVKTSDVEASSWLIATSVLMSAEPSVSSASTEIESAELEVPNRFVRVSDEEKPSAPESAPVAPASLSGIPGPAADADNTLLEIYRAEVNSHIVAIEGWVASRQGRVGPHPVSEALYRACHTLAGASRMASIPVANELAESLNVAVRRYFDHEAGLPDAAIGVLADSAAVFHAVTQADGTATELMRRLDLARRIAGILEQPFADLPSKADAEVPEETPSAKFEVAATGSFATIEFDPEIAAIFSEEATELLEAAARVVERIRSSPQRSTETSALKRYLHTLKGGARMAGVSAMGALAHEYEGLLTQYDVGHVGDLAEFVCVLELGLDALEQMRRRVQEGNPPAADAHLVERIRKLALPAPAPPTLRSLADEQPQPQPSPFDIEAPPQAPPLVTQVAHGSIADPADAPNGGAEIPASIEDGHARFADDDRRLTVSETPESMPAPENKIAGEPEAVAAPAVGGGRDERHELARVDAGLLDALLNGAGEVSIQRARIEQQLSGVNSNLSELSRVVSRLREQLRKLEIETETQILHRYQDDRKREEFDPLELDRYSALQQYSRALAESANDVASIQGILESQIRDSQNLLTQQARVVTDLQNGLMRTRMVPFQRHIPRLNRIIRQACTEEQKSAQLFVNGAAGELDRQILERMIPPFEHMLRNAVVHGIESSEERLRIGKPAEGRIDVSFRREGSEVVIILQDDGAGLDLKKIREKAFSTGLISSGQTISDADAMQLILEPGFSTAAVVTQSAGRGVGMDVVTNEVKRLGGSLRIDSTLSQGTRFTIRLPFTLAVSQALLLRTGAELFALPLPTVESVVRLPKSVVLKHLSEESPTWSYGGQIYRFQHLGLFVGGRPSDLPAQDVPVPVVLIRAAENSTAIVADELVGSREVVIKNVGPVVSSVRGVSGATILGDGRIVLIIDLIALVRGDWRSRVFGAPVDDNADRRTFALVVDDSITVRRVTQRLLERNGMRVLTARDGVDALTMLQDEIPDVILLDIEMPKMDGYEVAARIRADDRLKHIPIVMITSRVGEKHRARAIEIGVDDYLGKPYQESQLLDAIEPLVRRGRVSG